MAFFVVSSRGVPSRAKTVGHSSRTQKKVDVGYPASGVCGEPPRPASRTPSPLTPPGTPVSIEEREAEIRKNRALRLEKHPGLSPQEREALLGWEQRKVKQEHVHDLKNTIEAHRRGQQPGGQQHGSLSWKDDLSGFKETLAFKNCVRCEITKSVYTGQYKACQRHGKGSIKFDDGSSYEGEFADDQYCGEGVETTASGHRYVGEWKDNNKNGKGTFYWFDGRRYEGHWKSDQMSGFGVMHWRDGRRYHGTFSNDDFHGEGVFEWPDGRKLEASFRDGRASEGLLTEADGSRFRVRYGRDRPGAQVSKSSLALGQSATSLICFGTLPEPTFKETHVGREAGGQAPRTSGVAQPLTGLGDLARRVPL